MIIVRLMGGLGNQMFQYAVGKQLSTKNCSMMWLDKSFYDENLIGVTPRNYSLNHLSISAPLLPTPASKSIYGALTGKNSRTYARFVRRFFKHVPESVLDFQPEILLLEGNLFLDGFWQSERYFPDVKDIIRREFKVKFNMKSQCLGLAKFIRRNNSASVHVRRGDYVSNPNAAAFHGTCSQEWYRNAIDLIKKKTRAQVFIIFSDDIEWTKTNLSFIDNAIYVDETFSSTEYIDLYLMSCCKHHIIANSSFSWWAAWLNPSADKVVIAPRQWFNTTPTSSDRLPTDWIVL